MLKVNSDALYEAAMQYEAISRRLRFIAATLESTSLALSRSSNTYSQESVLIRKKSNQVAEEAAGCKRLADTLLTLSDQYRKCERDLTGFPVQPLGINIPGFLWPRGYPVFPPFLKHGDVIPPDRFSNAYDTLIDPLISRL